MVLHLVLRRKAAMACCGMGWGSVARRKWWRDVECDSGVAWRGAGRGEVAGGVGVGWRATCLRTSGRIGSRCRTAWRSCSVNLSIMACRVRGAELQRKSRPALHRWNTSPSHGREFQRSVLLSS